MWIFAIEANQKVLRHIFSYAKISDLYIESGGVNQKDMQIYVPDGEVAQVNEIDSAEDIIYNFFELVTCEFPLDYKFTEWNAEFFVGDTNLIFVGFRTIEIEEFWDKIDLSFLVI